MRKFWTKTLSFERENEFLAELTTEELTKQVQTYITQKYTLIPPDNTFVHSSLWVNPIISTIITKHTKNSFTIQLQYTRSDLIFIACGFTFFVALIGRFTNPNLWGIGLALGILYHLAHSWMIEQSLSNFFRKFPLYYHLSPSILLQKEQERWLSQQNTCPACGSPTSQYTQYCNQCGTLVNQNAKVAPYNISKYTAQNFNYTYKSKEK